MPKRKYDEPIISPWDRPGIMARAIELHAEGSSRTIIALILNKEYGTAFTASAISGRFGRNGIRSNVPTEPKRDTVSTKPAPPIWTPVEIDTMIKHSSFGADALSRLIKRSAKAIYRKASALGIKLGGPSLAKDHKPKPLPVPMFQYVSPFPERVIMACEYPDAVPLMKIGRCQCREVIGWAPDWQMCGRATISDSSSWCSEHAQKNLSGFTPKEDRGFKRAAVYHGHKGSQPRAW